jgi:hypothetical protein
MWYWRRAVGSTFHEWLPAGLQCWAMSRGRAFNWLSVPDALHLSLVPVLLVSSTHYMRGTPVGRSYILFKEDCCNF